MSSNGQSPEIDRATLHKWWERQMGWQCEVDEDMVRKSLDLPNPQRGGISAPKTTVIRNGLGWKELLVMGGLVLGGAYGAAKLSQSDSPPPAASPTDSEYEVRFYDADGNPIKVPHVSERPD